MTGETKGGASSPIKAQEERGVGTGLERAARHRRPAPGGRSGIIEGQIANSAPNGNTANAVVTATAAATKVGTFGKSRVHADIVCLTVTPLQLLKHRQKIINDLKLPAPLQTAAISAVYPLRIGDWPSGSGYGFILVEGEIMVGRGMWLIHRCFGLSTNRLVL